MRALVITISLGMLLAACSPNETPAPKETAQQPVAAKQAAAADPCQPPTQVTASNEETAWRLFVAAACPVNADKYPYVTWENWIEQTQLYAPTVQALLAGQRPRFHGSPLRSFLRAQAAAQQNNQPAPGIETFSFPDQNCPVSQFNRTICEETRINPDAQGYITGHGLTTKNGQVMFASAGNPFQFTAPSVEVKVDWLQLASCDSLPTDVHVEKVGDKCYALAGMHLISKLIDKWIWATFEPQNTTTNPRRCQELGCKDAWGSSPPTTSGAMTQLTPMLSDLMTNAHLAAEWRNYRLDGVQVDFLDGQTPTKLGNSIIEGENAAGPSAMKNSSCITCHEFSTIRTDGKRGMPPAFKVGNPLPLPAGMISRDFVWSLSLAQ